MKNLFKLIIIFLFLFNNLSKAQPVISYIIPDIGTPNLNTYYEIITRTNLVDNFGTDGFYLNNSNDSVRVEVLNPIDTQKIIFGPIVVSWEGRMISGQAFINPDVKPNSSDWSLLSSEFRIPFRVFVQGKGYSNIDTFYIVLPQHLGDISGINESVIGEGQLGRRSRRGAMIIDSLILGAKTYTISTQDCDPLINGSRGNQGYLPITILSRGIIKGTSNSRIALDGGMTKIQDAAPGGGGGGGRFYDATLLGNNNGDDGGNGFVSGGPGGRNNSGIPTQTNAFKNYGIGSDSSGYSLNGVAPPIKGQYEASGGATGHPFGRSGDPCFDGNTCEQTGGYGGGSGNKQTYAGGSGGYAVNGGGYKSSGGQVCGNAMIVPLAGGSGGASGNPQGAGTFSGSGGGGGGALSIAAPIISQVNFSANGANGGVGNGNGGNGSGGALLFYTKIDFDNSQITVNGGNTSPNAASCGRIRSDSKIWVNIQPLTPNANPYVGFTTDTNNLVPRKFVLSGKKPTNKNLKLYIKPESGVWQHYGDITSSASSWSQMISLPQPDSIFYFVALMDIDNPALAPYGQEPLAIFSQAGANIFLIDKLPHLVCDSVINARYFKCENFPKTFFTTLINTGDTNLTVEFQNQYFIKNNQGFSVISPTGYKVIKPMDSVKIQLSFSPPNNNFSNFFSDTLVFKHNDNFTTNPWKIALNVTLDTILLTIQNPNDLKPITPVYDGLDTLDLGAVCNNQNLQYDFILQNYSTNFININSIVFKNNYFAVQINSNLMDFQEPNNQQNLKITLLNKINTGPILDSMILKIDECNNYVKRVYLKAFIEYTLLNIIGDGNFGNVDMSSQKTRIYKIVNKGNKGALINDLTDLFLIKNGEFKILDVSPVLPVTLNPNTDTLFVTIQFKPSAEAIFSDSLFVKSIAGPNSCENDSSIELIAKGVTSKIEVSDDLLDFGLSSKCADIEKSVFIKNLPNATNDLIITRRAKITGVDINNFSISQEPSPIPYTIKPGDSVEYFVRYSGSAGGEGMKNTQLEIYTDSPTDSVIIVKLQAEREDLHIAVNPPNFIDLGVVYTGFDKDTIVSLTNLGRLNQYVIRILSDNPDLSVFPFGGWLNQNSSNSIDFKFTLNSKSSGNTLINTSFIFSDPCNDTVNIQFKAKAILSNYTIPDSLNFGILSSCEEKTDTLVVENNSQAPFIIKSINQITGTDAVLFKMQNSNIQFPDTVFPNEKQNIIVMFDPSNSQDGKKTASVTINLYVNGSDTQKVVYLTGERQSGVSISPLVLDFGDVIINTSSQLGLQVKANGIWNVEIYPISPIVNYPNNFSFINPGQVIVSAGGTIECQFTFTPTNIMDYQDSVVVTYQVDGCPSETVTIILRGRGIQPKNLLVWIPKIVTTPDQDNFEIPIYAKLDKQGDSISNFAIDTMSISFNRTLFFPKSLNNSDGVILKNEIQNNNRVLTLMFRNISINDQDSLLGKIVGATMLGDEDSTIISIDTIKYLDIARVNKISKQDGQLSILTCNKGSKRLLEVNPNALKGVIQPNPNAGNFDFKINLVESGTYKLFLCDMTGKDIKIDEFHFNVGDIKNYNKTFDLEGLSTGLYRIILITPSENYSFPMIIIK
jgi:hypothetical protein